ncbi:MAG: hypothetical protein H7831_08070 [Magnetococcus sp. WYHC-3]
MLDFLDKIRKLPEEQRRRFAFFVSAGVAFFVFIIWAVSFLGNLGANVAETQDALKDTKAMAPIESVFETIKSIF